MPFHYGYWDEPTDGDGPTRAAQRADADRLGPRQQAAVLQVRRRPGRQGRRRCRSSKQVVGAAGQVLDRASELADAVMGRRTQGAEPRGDYLGLLVEANEEFAAACDYMHKQHAQNAEIREGAKLMASFSRTRPSTGSSRS